MNKCRGNRTKSTSLTKQTKKQELAKKEEECNFKCAHLKKKK